MLPLLLKRIFANRSVLNFRWFLGTFNGQYHNVNLRPFSLFHQLYKWFWKSNQLHFPRTIFWLYFFNCTGKELDALLQQINSELPAIYEGLCSNVKFFWFTVLIIRVRAAHCLFMDKVRILVINWSCIFFFTFLYFSRHTSIIVLIGAQSASTTRV